jgi:NitT/TauT family transport system substrate-binding protein
VNTANEFYFGRYLELQGLRIANVTLVNLQPKDYVEATTNGTVDACVGSSVYTDQIQTNLGTNAVCWPVQNDQPAYVLLAARSDWVTSHPETVAKFLKSLSQAEDYFTNHRSSAQALIEEQLNVTISQKTWSENSISLT